MKTKIIWFVSGILVGSLLTLGILDYVRLHKRVTGIENVLRNAMQTQRQAGQARQAQ